MEYGQLKSRFVSLHLNNFSVMSGKVFLGLISAKQGVNCLA